MNGGKGTTRLRRRFPSGKGLLAGGSRGLHIFVPLKVGPTSDEVLEFATTLATRLTSAYPKELTPQNYLIQWFTRALWPERLCRPRSRRKPV